MTLSIPQTLLVSLALVSQFVVADGAKVVWSVAHPPKTTVFKELLSPFSLIRRSWGADSLDYSDKHGPSLRVNYTKGSYSKTSHRGGGFYSFPPNVATEGADDLMLKYDVYFENFGWGVMGKLPGLFGGVNSDDATRCAGGNNPTKCFSLRVTWRTPGEAELYAYISQNQSSEFSKRTDVVRQYPYGLSFGRGLIPFKNDEWQTVSEQVHLNSDPSTADGWVEVCVQYQDGKKPCFTAKGLIIRKSKEHRLRGMVFSTFFGGSKPYVAAPNDCHSYFRNFYLLKPDDSQIIG